MSTELRWANLNFPSKIHPLSFPKGIHITAVALASLLSILHKCIRYKNVSDAHLVPFVSMATF
jgi:hypothetical protein